MMILKIAVAAAALLAATVPSFAAMASPVGRWEIEMKDSRYDVVMCGDNGDQLCGTLIWLGNGADNAENLPYLNTMLIDHAPQIEPGKWRGDLHIFGQSAQGNIIQVSDDHISLEGCFLGIICKTYQLYRIGE